MPFYWRINFDNAKSAEGEAKRLADRTGENISGFRTVLGRFRPGSTKSAMDRAHNIDKKRYERRRKVVFGHDAVIKDETELTVKEGIRLDGTHLYSDKREAEAAALFLGKRGVKKKKHEGRLWYTPEDNAIGLYSNTTPAIKKYTSWGLGVNYATSEETELGTYSSYSLDKKCAKDLHKWFEDQGVKFIVPPEELHVSVVTTNNKIENYKPGQRKVVLDPKHFKMNVLGDDGNLALVMMVHSPILSQQYKKSVDLGGKYKYKSYKQHVTISYTWSKLQKLDNIKPYPYPIILDKETVKQNDLSESVEKTAKASFLGELKIILLMHDFKFVSSNINDIMVFVNDDKKAFLYPEPISNKSNQWIQWVIETNGSNKAGLTPFELNTYLRIHKK